MANTCSESGQHIFFFPCTNLLDFWVSGVFESCDGVKFQIDLILKLNSEMSGQTALYILLVLSHTTPSVTCTYHLNLMDLALLRR